MTALKPVLGAQVVSFSCEFVTHLPQLSMNWKRVELSIWLTEKHVSGLCRLLRSSPYLEELVLNVTSLRRDFLEVLLYLYLCYFESLKYRLSKNLLSKVDTVFLNNYILLLPIEAELGNWSIDDENCFSSSLKSVVVYNVSMCSYTSLVHLVSRLLNKASVLAELVIHYKANDKPLHDAVLSSEEWTKFSNKLPTFPKSSQDVRILLLSETITIWFGKRKWNFKFMDSTTDCNYQATLPIDRYFRVSILSKKPAEYILKFVNVLGIFLHFIL